MYCSREHLMSVLNGLYDLDTTRVSVAHPSDDIGELVEIRLEADGQATVRPIQGRFTYEERREEVGLDHGEAAQEDLPMPGALAWAYVASGVLEPGNSEELDTYLDRHAYPDLEAGHQPVVLGLDANIMAWRLPEVLGIDHRSGDRHDDRPATNGYALATGVKSELDWHYKQYNAHELTAAFGPEFERLADQPAGANREGFLGLYEFRRLQATRSVDLVDSGEGDADIVAAYEGYDEDSRKRPLLLSNDYGFVERAHDADLLAHHVDFPMDFPRSVTCSWTTATWLLYYLAVLFGVVTLPKVTLYGVWDDKDGHHWQHHELDLDVRSPKLEPELERDLELLDALDG
jgi:hypothetical protein